MGRCLIEPAKSLELLGQAIMGLRIIGLDVESLVPVSDSVLKLPRVSQHIGKIVVGRGKTWTQLQCLLIVGYGFVKVALTLNLVTKIVEDLRRVRLQTQGRPPMCNGLSYPALRLKHEAQVV